MYPENAGRVVYKQKSEYVQAEGDADTVGVFVGVGCGVLVGVGVGTHNIQLSKSGSPKSGPPGPQTSTKL